MKVAPFIEANSQRTDSLLSGPAFPFYSTPFSFFVCLFLILHCLTLFSFQHKTLLIFEYNVKHV